ncbi:sulfotransferase [Polymorphobacter sp. PAMC 29334]|uniref:tetratricopeptide repeat-containing sulfotransferase family protein n=1 Tax=Polymorphobacter sp. PAMC 29334 TaxID=2862331 RepID=UPI001C774456|nr:sulfotransferase [Polymorphobacter sp. PAMC 29334]QYE34366.1 sulfotransferase [Polymorphobacter sp. PAMC 29334]
MLDLATRTAIETALGNRQIGLAVTLAAAALAAGARDPMLFNLVAWRAEEAGDFAAAHHALGEAMALAPHDATIITAAGRALRKEGRIGAALAMFDRASAIEPGFAVPWLERGYALDVANDAIAALSSYQRAAALDPALAPAGAGAAAAAARLGQPVAELAARALAIDPHDATATMALARSELASDPARAAARLRGVLERHMAVADRIAALTLLGDALDRLDTPADAFAAYAAGKAMFAQLHAPRFAALAEPPQRDFIDGVATAVEAFVPAAWHARVAPPGRRGHVFLLGYPRSGTTLVENILASAAGVEALEERPTLIDADREFLTDPGGIARLAAIDAATATGFGDRYWQRVADAGVDPATTFVDMDPLKGIKLPLIARLFPDAGVVVMRRDPRDVVLSCFRQNFAITAAAYAFTTIEGVAEHYAALMRLTALCRERLPLAVHDLRYEDLVADFDTTTRSLCTFTGIDWSPDLRRFDRTATRRGVSTASAGQVNRPLYDGSGQWRRYADQLAPVMPILAPWIERFSYDL